MIGTALGHENVLSMPARKRYEFMVVQAARLEEAWALWGPDGWAVIRDEQGGEAYPVWPEKSYALDWCGSGMEGYYPKRMDVEYFLERWSTAAVNAGRRIAVFPAPGDPGLLVNPMSLFHDVSAELNYYEYK